VVQLAYKPEVSDKYFDAFHKVEWFTANATINRKTRQTKIKTFFKYFFVYKFLKL